MKVSVPRWLLIVYFKFYVFYNINIWVNVDEIKIQAER